MKINFSIQYLEKTARSHIKSALMEFAAFEETTDEYKETYKKQLEQQLKDENIYLHAENSEANNNQQDNYNISQHPDFIKLDGLPSKFNPENDHFVSEKSIDLLRDLEKNRNKDKNVHKLQNQPAFKNQLELAPKIRFAAKIEAPNNRPRTPPPRLTPHGS